MHLNNNEPFSNTSEYAASLRKDKVEEIDMGSKYFGRNDILQYDPDQAQNIKVGELPVLDVPQEESGGIEIMM